ncbi:MAG: TerC family protein [Deltaproteobacteria bacterium]|nr:TerC family protein [Deltaproteobacteria bacterium]
MDIGEIFTAANLIGLVTLVALEVVLGIDNIIFMAIQVEKLPPEQRERARKLGLMAAGGMRIILLLFIGLLMKLTADVFTIMGHGISGKDMVLIAGGGYLLWHSVKEIHEKVKGHTHIPGGKLRPAATFGRVLLSILMIDLVFSIDSVLTAIGMVKSIAVMVIAILISVGVMLLASGAVIRFIQKHKTVQILALAFLVLIGVLLVAEGFEQHVSKGYVYAAVIFASAVEFLQIRADQHAHQSEPRPS